MVQLYETYSTESFSSLLSATSMDNFCLASNRRIVMKLCHSKWHKRIHQSLCHSKWHKYQLVSNNSMN